MSFVIVIDGSNLVQHRFVPRKEEKRARHAPAVPSRFIQGWDWLDKHLRYLTAIAKVIVVYDDRGGFIGHHAEPVVTEYYTLVADDRIVPLAKTYVDRGDVVLVVTSDVELQQRCKDVGVAIAMPSGSLINRLKARKLTRVNRRLALQSLAELFEKVGLRAMATSNGTSNRCVFHGNVLLLCDPSTDVQLIRQETTVAIWQVHARDGEDRGYFEITSTAKQHLLSEGSDQLRKLKIALTANRAIGLANVCDQIEKQIAEMNCNASSEPVLWGLVYAEVYETRSLSSDGRTRRFYRVVLSDSENGATYRNCIFFALGRRMPDEKFVWVSLRGGAPLDICYPGPFNNVGQMYIFVTNSPVYNTIMMADGAPLVACHAPDEVNLSVDIRYFVPAPADFDTSVIATAGDDEAYKPFHTLTEDDNMGEGEEVADE